MTAIISGYALFTETWAQENSDEFQSLKLRVAELESKITSSQVTSPELKLIDVSVNTLIAAGGSTASGEELEDLQGGAHDPKRRGFTFQQAELSLSGIVDPYFSGEAHIIASEEGLELEEAFLTTLSLPYSLQIKAGYFLTEFGRINPSHPHNWGWVDQSFINTRIFGSEGMRGAGFRISKILPLPWYSELLLGVQNADGDFMTSFLGGEFGHDHGDHEHAEHEHDDEEDHDDELAEAIEASGFETGVGGRPIVGRDTKTLSDLVYLVRLVNSADINSEWTGLWGISALRGPNFTGDDAETYIFGTDIVLTWTPENNFRGWPFLKLESEFIYRDLEAAAFETEAEDGDVLELAGETLSDWGFYVQTTYGFKPKWSAGLRFELAGGSGESVGGRSSDPYRSDRRRISPLLAYHPSEFSRIRVQYNYDDADYLEGGDAHSVWLAFEILYGKHPAHKY